MVQVIQVIQVKQLIQVMQVKTSAYVTRHSSYFLLQGVKINKIHLERTEASVHDPLSHWSR